MTCLYHYKDKAYQKDEFKVRLKRLPPHEASKFMPSIKHIPSAPFKKDWHELMMKRLLRQAAEGGYHTLAWITGQQTADRYDLSKQISSVAYSGSNFKAFDLQGNEVISRTGVRSEDLPDLIGKHAAEKLMNQKPKGTLRILEGQDLTIGGKWAFNLYDKMIPQFMKKFTKKWGGNVGETFIPLPDPDDLPEGAQLPNDEAIDNGGYTVHALPITDDMREAVVREGVPMFKGNKRFRLMLGDRQ